MPRDMRNDWWFKFEHMVWLTDPDLNKCSLTTQGFWIRCLCMMRKSGTAKLSGSPLELCRILSVFPDDLDKCVNELRHTKTADVTLSSENVTIKSRRFHRELNTKEKNKLRKRRERAKSDVTPESQDRVRSKSKELEKPQERGHGEAPKESSSNGHSLSPSFPDSEYLSGRPRAVRGFAATPAAEQLDEWLGSIAQIVGAKSAQTMASAKGWNEATIAVIREGGKLERWLEIIESERDRNRDTPQFFTPNSCLKIFQSEATKPKVKKFYH